LFCWQDNLLAHLDVKDIVFVGTTKESLVRMLSEFKREGIIRSEGREIVIMDEARLKRTAIGF
jgi:CRP-like cAMP-binding protein